MVPGHARGGMPSARSGSTEGSGARLRGQAVQSRGAICGKDTRGTDLQEGRARGTGGCWGQPTATGTRLREQTLMKEVECPLGASTLRVSPWGVSCPSPTPSPWICSTLPGSRQIDVVRGQLIEDDAARWSNASCSFRDLTPSMPSV